MKRPPCIKQEVIYYDKVDQEVKLASGDLIDMKQYEPAMRHLLDTYVRAEDSVSVSTFDNLGLVDLLVEKGLDALDSVPESIRRSETAMAETIENNVRAHHHRRAVGESQVLRRNVGTADCPDRGTAAAGTGV